MKYIIDGKEYNIVIERKSNKNMYLKLKDDLTIYVTTNYLTPNSYIKDFIERNEKWIKKNIQRVNDKKCKKDENKGKISIEGKKYDIIIDDNVKKIIIDDDKVFTPSMIKLDKWIDKIRLSLYKNEIYRMYNLFEEDIPYPNLKIRKMGGERRITWGNCRKYNSTVTLNSKLIEYPVEALDYVIVHELSHFIYFDHSKSFWELVSKYCPNYKQISKELKE